MGKASGKSIQRIENETWTKIGVCRGFRLLHQNDDNTAQVNKRQEKQSHASVCALHTLFHTVSNKQIKPPKGD